MNAPAESPQAIVVEWLRNSATAIVLMLGGFAIADLISHTIGRHVPGSHMVGLSVGLAPFFWFLNRHLQVDLRWWEYVLCAALFVLVDVIHELLQLDIRTWGTVFAALFMVIKSVYGAWIRPKLIASRET